MERRLIYGMIGLGLLVPLAIVIWNPALGVVLFLIGLVVAVRLTETLRRASVSSLLEGEDALYARRDRARIVHVLLVDDDGNEFEPAVAQQRLEEARANAGPRDVVVGVRRRPDGVEPKRR